jgi:hypothetical protein
VIEIDLADITEPIVCCPNDPDDAKTLSDVAGAKIDEVFIGSCMTNIGHFRAASKLLEGKKDIPVKLWMAPPTKMDAKKLTEEGHYGVLGAAGARMEMPGCSLCMGNQAQVKEGATVLSTSTRNFPNRLGKNTNVYLGSAELAAICSKLGPHSHQGRVHGRHGLAVGQQRQDLPVPQLRPDRDLRGVGPDRDRLIRRFSRWKAPGSQALGLFCRKWRGFDCAEVSSAIP